MVPGPECLSNDVKYKIKREGHPFVQQGWKWFELSYNGRVLKYTVAIFGRQSNTGYPVFIDRCGGGTEKPPGFTILGLGSMHPRHTSTYQYKLKQR